ncbi:MAG: aspartate carbamoyltransferase catalytic subunit [Deltaproteobacteria bacterium]|nr:aspartate carbamoyltransferase catalytic subunit [Deltaproteobacteria bacterium]MCB9788283.1 aspartate carbamoyltransferase catalytic subunit [Deltaproteobacteria bacterium]
MTVQLTHLLGMDGVDRETITAILDLADHFKRVNQRKVKKVPALRGVMVLNFFVEASTRTRTSFEIAEKRLSADTLNFSASTSSLSKGETLVDTARTLQAMAPDIVVVRHQGAGVPLLLTRSIDAAIVNAGDGWHEHPTQALLDMLTMREHKGRLAGLRVAIVGDITHSRVARSNIYALVTMGAEVSVAGPRTMVPPALEELGVRVHHRIEPAIEGADVVMMLRIQKERMAGGLYPDDREYFRYFGLTRERLRLAASDAIVMHPGPMNRGVEIAPEVADGEHAVILEQVANGVAVRMAVLYLVAGGGREAVEA